MRVIADQILVMVAFGYHQQRLGNVLMSAMSNSMSLGMLNGDGFVLSVEPLSVNTRREARCVLKAPSQP